MGVVQNFLGLERNRGEIVAEYFDKGANQYLSNHLTPAIIREKAVIIDLLRTGCNKYDRVLQPGGITIMTFFHRFSPYWLSLGMYRALLPIS